MIIYDVVNTMSMKNYKSSRKLRVGLNLCFMFIVSLLFPLSLYLGMVSFLSSAQGGRHKVLVLAHKDSSLPPFLCNVHAQVVQCTCTRGHQAATCFTSVPKNSIRDARTPQPGKIGFNTMTHRSSETVQRLGYIQCSVTYTIGPNNVSVEKITSKIEKMYLKIKY